MKDKFLILALTLLGALSVSGPLLATSSFASGPQPPVEVAPGRVIVRLASGGLGGLSGPGSDIDQVNQLVGAGEFISLSEQGGLSASAVNVLQLYLVEYEADLDPYEVVEMYDGAAGVLYAEPDYLITLDDTPNDPNYSQLWGLHNTGQTGGTADADIDAPEAWITTTGSRSVVVAVIDTGVDYNHPDLAANIWTNTGEISGNGVDDDGNGYVDDVHGYDFYNNDGDPMDDHYHGTHVAGTIAAVGNNNRGVVGVAWQALIMALKFLSSSGSGWTSDAVQAVNYATANGARLSNNSWGGGGYSQSLYDAINAANSAGSLFMAAAGNSATNNDSSPHYPSSYNLPNVIAVAATTHYDQLSYFSNYGVSSVDLAAPGSSIYSTKPNDSYGSLSGTSMATPHVSGAAVLVWSAHSGWSAVQVKAALLNGVDTLSSLSGKVASGGRLNAANALTYDGATPTPTTPPTATPTPTVTPTPTPYGTPPPACAFPFSDDFETGSLGSCWTISTTDEGRVRVGSDYAHGGSYSLLLDDAQDGGNYSQAGAILTLDLSGQTQVDLGFWWREFSDENHSKDGVFVSDDNGVNWYLVKSFNSGSQSWVKETIDIDAAAVANGLTLTDHFQIKFQFYDNYSIPVDGYGIDDVEVKVSSTPTPTPTPTATATATPSPTPTPLPVSLSKVRPAQGFNDIVVFVDIFGANFQPGAQISLGATPLQTTFVLTEHLLAKVPAGLNPGTYDVTVINADGGTASLSNAYTVLDDSSANGDLRAEWYELWAHPSSPQEGETVSLGLIVERVGGAAGIGPFPVRFYNGTVATGHVIGDGYVAVLGRDDRESTTPVEWGQLSLGNYTITAVIDPDNIIPETDETNNTVQRTITIRPATADTTPPTINSLEINGGASQVTARTISLEVHATDNPGGSGLGSVLYVELRYIAGARRWVPVQWTSWLDYQNQPHSWTLHPAPGLRYIQTWVADKAGNISATPVKVLINYVPSVTSLIAGEINVYRQLAQAGQCLVVRVTPLSGDPDLYVWPPDYQTGDSYWYSLNGPDQVDAVTIPTTETETGVYQIEVEGASDGQYQLEVLVSDTCPSGTGEGWVTTEDKNARTEPLLSPGSEPPGDQAVPDPPSQRISAVYLPVIVKGQ